MGNPAELPLDLEDMQGGFYDGVRVETDRVYTEANQVFCDFRKVGGGLPAQARVAMVAPTAFYGEANHLLDSGVALVEIERHDRRVAIHAQGELRQIVRSDGKTVEDLAEFVDQEDVIWDFTHHVDFQITLAAF